MSDWPNKVFSECGQDCPNCGAWRRLVDDYFIEKCRKCGDEEIFIFETGEQEIP